MNILFVVNRPGHIVRFIDTVKILSKNGNQIIILIEEEKYSENIITPEWIQEQLSRNTQIRFSGNPCITRHGFIRNLSNSIRGIRNYLSYQKPEYNHTFKLKKRGENFAPKYARVVLLIFIKFWGLRFVNALNLFLKHLDDCIPPNNEIVEFINKNHIDVIIVTPLITGSYTQNEYVKAAMVKNIKSIYLLYSWDNLTNKGLIHAEPTLSIVWNKILKQEAISRHNLPGNKIMISGAPCFDSWFEMKPKISKEDLLKEVGLEPNVRYLLYLCSSSFIAPDEYTFIQKWVNHIESCAELNQYGIVIRPHPGNLCNWENATIRLNRKCAIYPSIKNIISPILNQDAFFHSIFYCDAVVGINSTAMIEAGILNKLVFTICMNDFMDTQEGTLHFQHIKEGGLLKIATSFDEHLKQLKDYLLGSPNEKLIEQEKVKKFIQSYILADTFEPPVSPHLAHTIEQFIKSEGNVEQSQVIHNMNS